MSELKPCPFCGSPAYSYHDNCIDFAGVKCNLGGCVCADILITENNWNTRPIEDNLIARIAELEEKQRWIPVSERLPDNWKPVMTIDVSESTRVPVPAFYDPETSLWSTHLPNYDLWVTHWMPLPEPPIVCGKESEE